jgi:hypothetical protein
VCFIDITYSPLGAVRIADSGIGVPKSGTLLPLKVTICAIVYLSLPHDPAELLVAWKAF